MTTTTTTRAEASGGTSASPEDPPSGISERTRRLLQGIENRSGASTKEQASGAGGGTTLKALERADAVWAKIRNMPMGDDAAAGSTPPRPFVVESDERMGVSACDFDVCICGGTLGILFGAALQARGQRVLVVERGALKGREQEWNISRSELMSLVPLGVGNHHRQPIAASGGGGRGECEGGEGVTSRGMEEARERQETMKRFRRLNLFKVVSARVFEQLNSAVTLGSGGEA